MAQLQGIEVQKKDIETYLGELKKKSLESIRGVSFNMLVLGELGVGKSHLLTTARKPVIVHAFDPGSARLRVYKKYIESGELMIIDYSDADGFIRWEEDFEKMVNDGILDQIGTYSIDSYTTWFRSMKTAQVKAKGRAEGIPYQSDYLVLSMNVVNVITLIAAAKCDFILTGHLDLDKEEVTGRLVARIKSIPSLKVDIPTLFDEVYVLHAENTSNGVERRLITQPTTRYQARTRIGSGIFEVYEEPDISKLLKKAGL